MGAAPLPAIVIGKESLGSSGAERHSARRNRGRKRPADNTLHNACSCQVEYVLSSVSHIPRTQSVMGLCLAFHGLECKEKAEKGAYIISQIGNINSSNGQILRNNPIRVASSFLTKRKVKNQIKIVATDGSRLIPQICFGGIFWHRELSDEISMVELQPLVFPHFRICTTRIPQSRCDKNVLAKLPFSSAVKLSEIRRRPPVCFSENKFGKKFRFRVINGFGGEASSRRFSQRFFGWRQQPFLSSGQDSINANMGGEFLSKPKF